MAVGFGYFHGDDFPQRWANCATTPLSWLNINPRDNLYLKGIACDGHPLSTITVGVESAMGVKEERTFTLKDGELSKFVGEGVGQNTSSVHLEAEHSQFIRGVTMDHGQIKYLRYPTTKDQLEQAQSIFRDFEYYRSLCQSPQLLDDATDLISSTGSGQKANANTSSGKINEDLIRSAPTGNVR
jgi:hypothetical protein